MATRYLYHTSIPYSEGDEPGELEVTVSYSVVWGRPEQGPAYDHGGLPADPDEINDVEVDLVDDFNVFSSDVEAAILHEITTNDRHYEAMLEEARQLEAAWTA